MLTPKKKVLFVIDTLQTGGAEKSLLEITSRLQKYTPVICTLFSKTSDLQAEFERRGIAVIELNLTGRFWLFQGVKKLRRVVADLKPALIHANLYNAELVTRLAFSKRKQLHIGSFVNDSYAKERFQQQKLKDNIKLTCYRLLDALTAQRVSHFTSITRTIAGTNAKALFLNKGNITTIYRGRNIAEYRVNHPPVEEKPFIFLAVARLLKRKGYLELIKAAGLLAQEPMSFKVMVAGDGPDQDLIYRAVADQGLASYFDFLGTSKDIPGLLYKAHCFVFPSHYEGQGGALVEAMLAAKPIVATRIPVIEEQVSDQETATLFNVFDAADLAEKMQWVYNNYDRAVEMGLKARTVARERFSIESIAEQHDLLYAKLLNDQ